MFDPVTLAEGGRKVAGADPGACGDDELCVAAVALAGLVSLASAGLAHVLAELDGPGGVRSGFRDDHGVMAGA
jgi:hypothetical protein